MRVTKCILVSLMAVALCLSMTACMNNGGNVAPQQTTRTDFMPEATNMTTDNANNMNVNNVVGATQAPVAFDWLTGSGQVEANVNRISEISDCRVVTAGTTALVGVRFTSAYQGEMTERIREMVAAEVMKADPSIQTVAVTAEEDDVEDVYEIAEELRNGKPAESVADDINEIVRNATTLR